MLSDINQITDTIYLGDIESAFNKKKLKSLGIKKVLTVMSAFGNHYNEHEFVHKSIEVDDAYDENIIKYFKECLLFMDGYDKVFVHCAAGMSRSATIVIAYLMWKQKMSLNDAFNFVKKKRPVISPNLNFMRQLQTFQDLLIKKDYDINKINFKNIKIKDTKCITF
jgi:protein-tyrosine phosphatase